MDSLSRVSEAGCILDDTEPTGAVPILAKERSCRFPVITARCVMSGRPRAFVGMAAEEGGIPALAPATVHAVLASTDSGGFVSLRRRPPPRSERYAIGAGLREKVKRSALGKWSPTSDRADVV